MIRGVRPRARHGAAALRCGPGCRVERHQARS